MPFRSVTYQSSILVKQTNQNHFGFTSYIDHIEASSIRRHQHALKINGLVEEEPEIVGAMNSSFASSPIRKRVSSVDSMPSMVTMDSDSDRDDTDAAIQSLRSYLQPEKAKARPYLYKQYKLPGVSAAQIIQIRTR